MTKENANLPGKLSFGPFVLDVKGAKLTRDGVTVDLPPRPFDLLSHLVSHSGVLVTKDELLDAVWGHRHVSESVLKGAINTLRTALAESAKTPEWIETVPRRGYRFKGDTRSAGAASELAGQESALSGQGNVPNSGAPLIGREADLAALHHMLLSHRLVTLAGSGGIGKTQLALALCRAESSEGDARFADGVWLIRLDALTDGTAIVATIARSLGLGAEAARNAESLAFALRTTSVLLVLDNCEHLLEHLAPLVQSIMAEGPGVRVLATSQEPLHIEGEHVYRLNPLPYPATGDLDGASAYGAVALFVQRVVERDSLFVLDDGNCAAVCDICRALDGLPLALELAAARVELLGVDGVRDRLSQRLALLTAQGARDQAPRQRTLRATLAWSYGLLSAQEQLVLRRLAVFRGSFSLDAAQAVAADAGMDDWVVLDALGGLVDKSLLHRVAAAAPSTAHRLRMFDSIRSFATEQLDAAGELEALCKRHLDWVLGLFVDAERDVHDSPTLEWTARLLPELDNLRAAMEHAHQTDPEAALALYCASVMFWHRCGLKHEALRWSKALEGAVSHNTPVSLRAAFAQAQAVLCAYGMLGLPADAQSALDQALTLHQELGDGLNEYFDLYVMAHLMLRIDRQLDRTHLWERMCALQAPDWGLMRRRYARWLPALAMRDRGDSEGYRQFCIDEIARLQSVNDRNGVWTTTYGLALAEHDRGEIGLALTLLEGVVDDIRRAGLLREHPTIVGLLASMRLEQGEMPSQVAAIREAVSILRVDGTLWWMAHALGFSPLHASEPADAARVIGWADAAAARRGESPGVFFARLRLRCMERLQQAFKPKALAALLAEGATLKDEQALALARVLPDARADLS